MLHNLWDSLFVAESNSSRLENKLVRISNGEYNYIPLTGTELKFVVSLGTLDDDEQYRHLCVANMISVSQVLTTIKCGTQK